MKIIGAMSTAFSSMDDNHLVGCFVTVHYPAFSLLLLTTKILILFLLLLLLCCADWWYLAA